MVGVAQLQLIAIVLLTLALAYVLYLYWKRQDMIECPSCGARVHLYADECPHCGHEKQAVADQDQYRDEAADIPGEAADTEDDVEADRYEKEIVDEAEPETDEEPADVADDGYVCEECGRSFDSEHGLKTHAGQAH